ncbi:MAG: recombination mediator RecR [Candidatus Erginobacter occultus]|nr:recombination mediator RecR [Candidatus Erginobacter occultus]
MARYPLLMQRALDALTELPGIGPRSAQRILFHILRERREETQTLLDSLAAVKARIRFCPICGNLTSHQTCSICRDPSRDRGLICVVEDPKDVIALEQAGKFPGVYHVLMGKIVPLDGIGHEDIRVKELLDRAAKNAPREVIIATGSDIDGETTALYLSRELKAAGVKVTRIAAGIPVGSSLDFMDPVTLMKALEGRREY